MRRNRRVPAPKPKRPMVSRDARSYRHDKGVNKGVRRMFSLTSSPP